jgi:hypothetical protein
MDNGQRKLGPIANSYGFNHGWIHVHCKKMRPLPQTIQKMVVMCNFASYMHCHVRLPASPSKRRGGEQRHDRVEADS